MPNIFDSSQQAVIRISGKRIEVAQPVVTLDRRRLIIVAQPKIQREARAQFPVVLQIQALECSARDVPRLNSPLALETAPSKNVASPEPVPAGRCGSAVSELLKVNEPQQLPQAVVL